MGRVTRSFPVKLSDLKSGYSATGTRSLREFIAGGSYANTHTAAIPGWVPTSGTLKLSDFRGATNVFVQHGESFNYTVSAEATADDGPEIVATTQIMIAANGKMILTALPENLLESGSPNLGEVDAWLHRNVELPDTTVCGMFEVLFVKVAGTSIFTGVANNTWVRCDTDKTISLISTWVSGGPEIKTVTGDLKIRRYDNQTELANVRFEMSSIAYGGP